MVQLIRIYISRCRVDLTAICCYTVRRRNTSTSATVVGSRQRFFYELNTVSLHPSSETTTRMTMIACRTVGYEHISLDISDTGDCIWIIDLIYLLNMYTNNIESAISLFTLFNFFCCRYLRVSPLVRASN